MIPWLTGRHPAFPPQHTALPDPNGLLAAGGRLDPEWLLAAYARGIFPWYSPGDPLLWWSPDPRMVLFPPELRLRRSFAKVLRNRPYTVTCDTEFDAVLEACAAPRDGQGGTWIVPDMQAAYRRLFELGWAHSVEVRMDGDLIGGLYGVALGAVFYGESMFSRERDGSKIALAHLARDLERRNFVVIDCQMKTAHLDSMGAREIARASFVELVGRHTRSAQPGRWPAGRMSDIVWRDA